MSLSKNLKHWLDASCELIIHILVGTILFAVLFSVVIGIDLFIAYLKSTFEIGEVVIGLLTTVKYSVATIDVVCYGSLMIRMAVKFNSKIWTKENV